MKEKKKILYVYRTARKKQLYKALLNEEPDHLLYGFRYLSDFGIDAYFTDIAYSPFNLLLWLFLPLQKYIIKRTSIGFKLDQAILLIPKLINSDLIVTTTDSAGLPILLLKKLKIISKPMIYISTGLVNELDKRTNSISRFEFSLLREASIIVCHSIVEKKLFIKHLPDIKKKIYVIPFGIDYGFFKTNSYILSVGRDRSRDFQLLAEVAKQFPKEQFIIVTSKSNVGGINFSRNVKLLFDIDYRRVRELYWGSKIIFLPLKELNRAAGQISFLESASLGKIIVASRVKGLIETYKKLVKSENILFYQVGDIKDAVVTLKKALKKVPRSKLEILSQYTSKNYSKRIAKIIDDLLVEKLRICFFGSFDPQFTRNNLMIKSLNNHQVELCNLPSKPLKNYLYLLKDFIINHRDSNVIFVGVLGHYDIPLAWLLAKLFRKRLIFDAFISLYDTYVNDRRVVSKFSLKAIKYFLWDFISTHLADIVLLDTKTHANYFKNKFKLNPEKIKIIYVGADNEFFKYTIKKEISNKFIIGFYGSFQPLQGVDFIVKAAALIHDENIEFRVLGDGQTKKEVIKLAGSLKLKNIKFFPRTTIEGVRDFIAEVDVCLGIFGSTEKARNVIPTKIYQAIAMRKPVITMDSPAIREIFKDRRNIVLIPNDDPSKLAEAIVNFKNNSQLKNYISLNAYNLFVKKLTPDKISLKLKSVLDYKL